MEYAMLDTVVLLRDIPDHGLRAGDLGAVVELFPPDSLEVEFVDASGRTTALMVLRTSEVRSIADTDVVAVRTGSRSA
jgi:hypothetical protein